MKTKILLAILVVVVLAACTSEPISLPTKTTIPTATITFSPVPPTETLTPTPAPENSTNIAKCSESGSLDEFDYPKDMGCFKLFVLDYLNKGGTPEQLSEVVKRLAEQVKKSISLQSWLVDITGDGVDDLVLFANMQGETEIDAEDAIWVFEQYSGKYKDIGQPNWQGILWHPYQILSTDDLNGDDKHEVILSVIGEGSWCHGQYMVIGFENQQAVEYLDLDVNCGTKLKIQDKDNDGQKELIFTGEKVGVTPPQKVVLTYKFNNEQRIYYNESETYHP